MRILIEGKVIRGICAPSCEVCDGPLLATAAPILLHRDAESSQRSAAAPPRAPLRKLRVAANRERASAGHPTDIEALSNHPRNDIETTFKAHRRCNESAFNFSDYCRPSGTIDDNR